MQLDNGFAERLKWALQSTNKNLSDLAREMKTRGDKLSPQAVQQWTAGETTPRQSRMDMIAEILGVRPDWLAWGRGSMRSTPSVVVPTGPHDAQKNGAAREWWQRFAAAVPPASGVLLDERVHSGPHAYRVDCRVGKVAAMVVTVPDTLPMSALLAAARVRLWVLSVAHVIQPDIQRVLVLALVGETQPAGMPAYMEAIQHEAALMGCAAIYAGSPEDAARALIGIAHGEPVTAQADALDLDVMDV